MVSISEFLDAFGFENMLLIAVFLMSFALINFTLQRVFKRQFKEKNTAVTSVISFCIAMLITYGVNAMQLDLGSFFFDMGIESAMLEMIVYFVLLAGIAFIFWKFGFAKILMLTGVLLVAVSLFTDWFYEKEIILGTGIAIFFVGLIIYYFKSRKKKEEIRPYGTSYPSSNIDREQRERERQYRERIEQERVARADAEERARRQRELLERQRQSARQQRERAQRAEALLIQQDAAARAAAQEAARQGTPEAAETARRAAQEAERQRQITQQEIDRAARAEAENIRALNEATARNLERQEQEERQRRAQAEVARQREQGIREQENRVREQRKKLILRELESKNQQLAQRYAEYKQYVQFVKMNSNNPQTMSTEQGRDRVRKYGEEARRMYQEILTLQSQMKEMQRSL